VAPVPEGVPPVRGARAWADVDLDAASANFHALRSRLQPGTQVMAVLKADAYGHGAVPAAKRLLLEGVSMLGVGDSTEALELREAGVVAPILVLGAVVPGETEKLVAYGIAVCVHSLQRIDSLARAAEAQGRVVDVHVKVDTGMGRLGAQPAMAVPMAKAVTTSPHLRLAGVCTHYASASSPVPFQTESQFESFRRVLADLTAEDLLPPLVHAGSTAALLGPLREHFSMVRIGGGLWGIDPGNHEGSDVPLRPCLSLRTQVIFLKDFPQGSPVGYHRTFETRRASRLATIPIGYNDGYAWGLGNRAEALVRGRRVPVVGAVSMDYTTLDVTDVPGVETGDEVTLVGRDGDEEIRIEDLARLLRTNPYEITCGLGKRVVRVHRGTTGPGS
jgi:alanine racemase